MQISAAQLGRLDPADDSLESKARLIEDDLDRLHAFGRSLRYQTTAADELGQIRAQSGLQMRAETCDETATLAWCETESRIRSDGKSDATADDSILVSGTLPYNKTIWEQIRETVERSSSSTRRAGPRRMYRAQDIEGSTATDDPIGPRGAAWLALDTYVYPALIRDARG